MRRSRSSVSSSKSSAIIIMLCLAAKCLLFPLLGESRLIV
jgi:hypothetical protein